jgi:hypothetical protein
MKYLEVVAEEYLIKHALGEKWITEEQYVRFKPRSGHHLKFIGRQAWVRKNLGENKYKHTTVQ